MIIFLGEGRLGNQLFQYSFVKNFLKTNEKVLVCNWKELLETFIIKDNISNYDSKLCRAILLKIGIPILKLLSSLRFISSCYPKTSKINGFYCENGGYTLRKGLIKILYIYPGYYQSEQYFNTSMIKHSIELKKEYLKKGLMFINKLNKDNPKVFVHIRRGDYLYHNVLGNKNVALPITYYKKSLEVIQKELTTPFFIFLSDDPNYVKNNFEFVKNKVISKEDMRVDLAIMTLCDGGIMSNSSFAWWGGFLGMQKHIISPKYWLGFKSFKDFPIGIVPSFAQVVKF